MSALKKGGMFVDKKQTAKVSQSIKDKNEASRKMLSEKGDAWMQGFQNCER